MAKGKGRPLTDFCVTMDNGVYAVRERMPNFENEALFVLCDRLIRIDGWNNLND